MDFFTTAFYFVITIGVLVFIHELGHFLAAKLFGMRVDRFSIGFPPRAFGKKIGETDYCVSWIPIGGYVKIAGMIDESFDTDFQNQPVQPWEFRAKPIWQRMIVLVAGVTMNILLAVSIFWGIIYYQGKMIRPVTEIGHVVAESPAGNAGLRVDDKILSVNGRSVTYWEDIESLVFSEALTTDVTFTIARNGETQTLVVPRSASGEILEGRFGIFPKGLAPVVSRVEPNNPAEAIGLEPQDVITAVNGKPVTFNSLSETLRRYPGTEITLTWKRGDQTHEARVTPTAEGRIGVALGIRYTGPVEQVKYSLLAALPQGISDAWEMTWLNLKGIYQIIIGKISLSKSVAGPIGIAQMATRSAEVGIASFLGFMALLSMNLALLNLLPFPALDGGHLMFLSYEAVFRREIPNKVKLAVQQVGFVLLLVFMAFVLYNDIVKF